MAKWTLADMPDQTGRIAVVTGANTGIGFETAAADAAKNELDARRLWQVSEELTGVSFPGLSTAAA